MFNRRGQLSVLGGWREATQVGFYGVGTNTSKDDRTNYLFQQPYGSALFTLFPTRRVLMLRGGVELTQWSQEPGEGTFPSVETRYTPATLPGLGAEVTYLHTQGDVGLDWRTSPGYSAPRRVPRRHAARLQRQRRRVRLPDGRIRRDRAPSRSCARRGCSRSAAASSTRRSKDGQQIPFFMLPSLGGGSSLRGYASWRFRDQNSLLLQAEWRIMVNRYLDLAFFYDAGKVAARTIGSRPRRT